MGNCNFTPGNECGRNNNTQNRPAPYMRQRTTSMRPSAPCPGIRQSDPLSNMPVAMAYVPWQFFREVYEPDKALQYGTIFPELNKPFYGKGGCPR